MKKLAMALPLVMLVGCGSPMDYSEVQRQTELCLSHGMDAKLYLAMSKQVTGVVCLGDEDTIWSIKQLEGK